MYEQEKLRKPLKGALYLSQSTPAAAKAMARQAEVAEFI